MPRSPLRRRKITRFTLASTHPDALSLAAGLLIIEIASRGRVDAAYTGTTPEGNFKVEVDIFPDSIAALAVREIAERYGFTIIAQEKVE